MNLDFMSTLLSVQRQGQGWNHPRHGVTQWSTPNHEYLVTAMDTIMNVKVKIFPLIQLNNYSILRFRHTITCNINLQKSIILSWFIGLDIVLF